MWGRVLNGLPPLSRREMRGFGEKLRERAASGGSGWLLERTAISGQLTARIGRTRRHSGARRQGHLQECWARENVGTLLLSSVAGRVGLMDPTRLVGEYLAAMALRFVVRSATTVRSLLGRIASVRSSHCGK